MKLSGLGPWGVEDVSRATGIPVRTLQRWHNEHWAEARDTTSARACLRYRRDDVVRICLMEALKSFGFRTGGAARICNAHDALVREAIYHEPQPVVSFRET